MKSEFDKLLYEEKLDAENKKKLLIDSLSPKQQEYLDATRWFTSQARGQGKTYLLCVTALLNLLDGRDGYVIDHVPQESPYDSYIADIIFSIAQRFEIKNVAVRRVRSGVYKVFVKK